MKNRVTILGSEQYAAPTHEHNGQVPVPVLIGIGLVLCVLLAINLIFVGQPWLSKMNAVLPFAAPVIVVGGLMALLSNDNFRKAVTPVRISRKPITYTDKVANKVPWSAMRAEVTGEARNCKICKRSTASRLSLAPIFTLHYAAVIIAAAIVACLVSIHLSGNLPLIPESAADAAPELNMFVFLLGGLSLAYIAFLLRKPLRSIEFNKNNGVFWVEKQRIFGWKVGESAQMPISQVYAIQIISYSNRKARMDYSEQTGQSAGMDSQRTVKEYEANVVFQTGERVNIINHRNHKWIKRDSKYLADFLGVPVWDRDEDERRAHAEAVAQAATNA